MKPLDSSREPAPTDVFVVASVEQARLLTDPDSVRYFKPFVAAERSLTQAAAEVGCRVNTLHYRVGTFLRAGLLEVTREQPRAGRAIRFYRSVAPTLFIPFSLTPYATLEESLAEQLQPVWTAVQTGLALAHGRSGVGGRVIYRDDHGVVLTTAASDPRVAHDTGEAADIDAFYSDIVLDLSEEDAAALNRRLTALFRDVYTRALNPDTATGLGRRSYTLQAALVPYRPAR